MTLALAYVVLPDFDRWSWASPITIPFGPPGFTTRCAFFSSFSNRRHFLPNG
jgi:hypothetical protein